MLAMMLAHVNEACSLLNKPEGGFTNFFRGSDKSNDSTVGGFTGIDIDETNAFNGFNYITYLPDDV